jgi:hypothetical protein
MGRLPRELSEKLTSSGAVPDWVLVKKSATGGLITVMKPEGGADSGSAAKTAGANPQKTIAKSRTKSVRFFMVLLGYISS